MAQRLAPICPSLMSHRQDAGFSLAETIVILVMVGVLAAIGGVSWLSFLSNQRMRVAVNESVSSIRLAQAGARRENLRWVAAFRESNGQVQWAVTRATAPVAQWDWQNLLGEGANLIEIDPTNTTFNQVDGIYQVAFEYDGRMSIVNTPPRRITFRPVNNTSADVQRCIRMVTMLGALRTENGATCNS